MSFEDIRPAINRSILILYRIFAVVTLYSVLAGVLFFAIVVAFYAASHSWVAPAILARADKDTLDLTGKILTTQSTVEALKLDVGNLRKTLAEAQIHKAALEKLRPAIDAAIARENQHRLETGPVLVDLDKQKQVDNVQTKKLLEQLAKVDAMIDEELASGLITKADAIQAKLEFSKSTSELTDSRIAATLLKDSIQEKMTTTTTYLETLDKKVELESQIATLLISMETAQRQITTETVEIEQFDKALETAQQTPYWVAMQSGDIILALVPYDNQEVAVEGAPVYDCYLSFIVCHKVGTLKEKFVGEQHATHPIFHTDLRGYLVRLDLTDPNAGKSRTLFLGAKPLYF